MRASGALCLALDLAYVLLALRRRGPLRIRGWSFELPHWRLALGQVVVGTLNFAILAGALHAVIGPSTGAAFLIVATTFVLANCAALISHVPGGLGVIEWVILSVFPAANAFGPLLVYRTIYYLLPLALGALVFAATAFRRRLEPAAA